LVGGFALSAELTDRFLFEAFDGTTACEEAVVSDRFCFEYLFYSSTSFILYLPVKHCQQDFYAFLKVPVDN
jgi:hypothetical protein